MLDSAHACSIMPAARILVVPKSLDCFQQPHLGPPPTHPLAIGPGTVFKVRPGLLPLLGMEFVTSAVF